MAEHEYTQLIDLSTGKSTPVTLDVEHNPGEVLTMVVGDEEDDQMDNVTVGRMPVGMDESDFDYLPTRVVDMDPEDPWQTDSFSGDDRPSKAHRVNRVKDDGALDEQDDSEEIESPSVFRSPSPPVAESFPVFKQELAKAQAGDDKPRAVRIDTEQSYDGFVCERAIKEIARRTDELRSALEDHLAAHETDEHPGFKSKAKQMRKWDEVLGAVKAVTKIKGAATAAEAADAMPQIPLDIDPDLKGSIKCWKDGKNIVCSIKFQAADGTGRIATMAAKPKLDAEIVGWALRSGVNPVTVLGMLPTAANVACGKKLVKDVAGAALESYRRIDVCGMAGDKEPLLLASGGDANSASVKALMMLEKRANSGDSQAARELGVIRLASKTTSGQKIAAPLLEEASRRLAAGPTDVLGADAAPKPLPSHSSFIARYTMMGMML